MTAHTVFYFFISSLIALFPLINPIGDGLIVNGYLQGLDYKERKIAARRIFINCVLISIGSLILGHLVLMMFGLAIPVIQVAGGIIICKTGYDLLNNNDTVAAKPSEDEVKKIDQNAIRMKLFYPISFPISIDPGTISVIFTLMATASVKDDFLKTSLHYAMIALAIIILLAFLYLFLVQGPRIMKKLGDSANMTINKFVAFITFCIGIQILVIGLGKVFHLTIL